MKNALKFTSHGKVELKVRERAANGGIEFSVTDTGIGIEKQYHEKIFERFYKVDTFKQGLGLGLTMSRKIAKLLGGSLDIDPSYKKGARFLLVLPSWNDFLDVAEFVKRFEWRQVVDIQT